MHKSGSREGPAIDVAMPVLNGAHYLGEAIESVLRQEWTDWRLSISVNINSTDESLQIANEFAQRDQRVSVIHDVSGPAASNFSRLLRASSAPLMCFLAHDDVMHPQLLSTAVDAIRTTQVDYFIPNWHVGPSIAEWPQPQPHLLKFLEMDDAVARLLLFINLHHDTHKCNLVYSIFRRQVIAETWKRCDISNDGVFSSLIAGAFQACVSDEVLFFKRHGREKQVVSPFIQWLRLMPAKDSSQFVVARDSARRLLLAEFPDLAPAIESIFARYREYRTRRSGRILSDSQIARILSRSTTSLGG